MLAIQCVALSQTKGLCVKSNSSTFGGKEAMISYFPTKPTSDPKFTDPLGILQQEVVTVPSFYEKSLQVL